jgi:BlaI family penicillinase repressor
MAPDDVTLPTVSELEILRVLWARGPSTVREVYHVISAERPIGYSTVLKFMQIMTDKGLLVRDERVRPQQYRTAHPQQRTQRRMLRDLVTRAFGGSATSLVLQALSDRRSTPDERRQIRQLLDALERKTS